MADNELMPKENPGDSSVDDTTCPHCGAASGSYPATTDSAVGSDSATNGADSAQSGQSTSQAQVQAAVDATMIAALASSTGSLPGGNSPVSTEGLSKWEQDTYRDIISNVNNTLRFQIQLAVPILAGCVTALNLVPPQEHQEFLNNYDRWVFIPVLLSMGVSYYGLEMHWGLEKGKPTDNHEVLSKLVKRKYFLMHTAIVLQAAGLILLFLFVLLEFK